MKKPHALYFWWSATSVYSVRFVRWHRMRMSTGGEDSNKLGVGVIGASDLLTRTPLGFWGGKACYPRIDNGCVRGQMAIRPYTPLYRSYDDAWKHKRPVRRPSLEHVEQLIKRRARRRRAKHGLKTRRS